MGISSKPLTIDEQNGLREALEDFEISLTNKTVNVNANGASMLLDGPWGKELNPYQPTQPKFKNHINKKTFRNERLNSLGYIR